MIENSKVKIEMSNFIRISLFALLRWFLAFFLENKSWHSVLWGVSTISSHIHSDESAVHCLSLVPTQLSNCWTQSKVLWSLLFVTLWTLIKEGTLQKVVCRGWDCSLQPFRGIGHKWLINITEHPVPLQLGLQGCENLLMDSDEIN